ncbi:LysR family transcriptional regulator [Peribacillus sp. SCS-26]|uniref:LysR family transcriptional regulator n=1 Tax=Paraperibacillus marinus TaxID=3115295 RepID=UPI003905B288
MSIAKYEIFNTTVEAGSLTKASAALNISQSGVSHAITSLEQELGFAMLIRNKGGIRLTPNGERMLSYIRDILYLQEKMSQEAAELKGQEIGKIRIAAFSPITAVWLPGMLHKFSEQYPDIVVEVAEGRQEEIQAWITAGTVDFGFLMDPPSPSLDFLHLKQEHFFCIIPKENSLLTQSSIRPGQLKGHKLLLQSTSAEKITKILKGEKVTVDIPFILTDDQAVIAMAAASHGIAILPEISLQTLPDSVAKVPFTSKTAFTSIGISAQNMKNMPLAAEKFIAAATLWLNEYY